MGEKFSGRTMKKKSAKKEAQWVGVWAKCAKKFVVILKKICAKKERLNFFVVIVVSEGVEV